MSDKIGEDDPILIGAQGAPGKKCYFQAYNGDFSSQDDVNIKKTIPLLHYILKYFSFPYTQGLNCDKDYDPADGEDNHKAVHYACLKRSACGM